MQQAIDRVRESVLGVQTDGRVGAGVVVDAISHAVTCAHVVADAGEATVTLADGSKVKAKVVATDEQRDLALLELERQGLPAAQFADSSTLEQGAAIAAIGSPLGLEGSVTSGVVSAVNREVGGRKYLQVDAALNRGSSGGPIIDEKGRVVGLATKMVESAQNVGFAIPAEEVMDFLRDNNVIAMQALGRPRQSEAPPQPKASSAPGPVAPAQTPAGLSLLWVIVLPVIVSLLTSSLVVLLLSRHIARSALQQVPVTLQPGGAAIAAPQPQAQEEDLSDVDIDLL